MGFVDMLAHVSDCVFLDSRRGSFKPDGSDETVEYQTAEFFQKDNGTFNLSVDSEIECESVPPMSHCSLDVDFRSYSTGRGRAFRGRVVDLSVIGYE